MNERHQRVIYLALILCLLAGVSACGNGNGVGSQSWNCSVSLSLDSMVGEGSGSGGTRDEALIAALKTACSKLDLDSTTRSRCEQNMDFGTTQTIGNITIVTPAEKRLSCSGSS